MWRLSDKKIVRHITFLAIIASRFRYRSDRSTIFLIGWRYIFSIFPGFKVLDSRRSWDGFRLIPPRFSYFGFASPYVTTPLRPYHPITINTKKLWFLGLSILNNFHRRLNTVNAIHFINKLSRSKSWFISLDYRCGHLRLFISSKTSH